MIFRIIIIARMMVMSFTFVTFFLSGNPTTAADLKTDILALTGGARAKIVFCRGENDGVSILAFDTHDGHTRTLVNNGLHIERREGVGSPAYWAPWPTISMLWPRW